ncbi:hypothetical protein [Methylobacterium soli]|jgi:hypothetical protein|uniref:Uncharacterized protein n=1 Tax=Methylobacterium soli TaxID=553447 RepID=A0A6L3T8E5_9HYPH|nr:hypothetical protein [Methylobacterium soli]KAB1081861.1 hypothetical protein F6X53_01835 [Methylobacterium soli]
MSTGYDIEQMPGRLASELTEPQETRILAHLRAIFSKIADSATKQLGLPEVRVADPRLDG